jgi:hypothetical protein
MTEKTADTFWVRIYMSGPIEIAKQVCRAECRKEGLCVTIEPTTFIYTGGEESGFVIGLIQYPRFPKPEPELFDRAVALARVLLDTTHQHSALVMGADKIRWMSNREQS